MPSKPNIYEKRWQNALKIANKINELIDQGYWVFDEDGVKLYGKFRITEEEIVLPLGQGSCILYFVRSKDWDNGCYTKIKDFNKHFEGWTYVLPSNIKKIRL